MKNFFVASAIVGSFLVGRGFAPAPVSEVNAESFDCRASLSTAEHRLQICEEAVATITRVTEKVRGPGATPAAPQPSSAELNRAFVRQYRLTAIRVARARQQGSERAKLVERLFTAINFSRALADNNVRHQSVLRLNRIARELGPHSDSALSAQKIK